MLIQIIKSLINGQHAAFKEKIINQTLENKLCPNIVLVYYQAPLIVVITTKHKSHMVGLVSIEDQRQKAKFARMY